MNTWRHDILLPETGDDKAYIRLRQPNNSEWKIMLRVQKDMVKFETDSDAACDALSSFCDLLKTLIVDHNIEEAGKKLSSKEIADYINGDIMLTSRVLNEYYHALPLMNASSTTSGK